MSKLQDKLDKELKNNLSFWLKYGLKPASENIYPEVSINTTPNTNALTGVMYLSRILYGASTASKLLKTQDYIRLAKTSFESLKDFKNPKGGYYWAKDASNKIYHDSENTNMAQAFVLYGLVGYARLKPSSAIDKLIENQFSFIKNTLYDKTNGGYIDGFDENWNLGENPTKALGTHLHLLEAFVKLYEYKKDENIVPLIEELITIILQKFINKSYDCLHRLTPDWKPLPNEIWAGHNAECSWILCASSKAIQNEKLQTQCDEIAIKIMQQVIEKALDTKNGGVFNVLRNDIPSEKVKIWWPQAETVLGLLNCYKITGENFYKLKAIDLLNYISTNFIAESGEWYTEIWNTGKPNMDIPLVHFWKSMYHTIRYYSEVKEAF